MWDLVLSDEQAMIAESVRQFLAGELPIERLRPGTPPQDHGRAREGMARLGWFGIGIAEETGGMGLGLIEEMLVQKGCGKHLASPSVLATVIAAHVAQAAGDRALASDLVSGERSAALAIPLGAAGEALAFDWTTEDLLLVWNEHGAGLFEPASFASPRTDTSLDDSLSLHRGTLTAASHWVDAAAAPIGLRADALLAARLAGLAEGACELATAYAKVREQFGKPIGSFQAVKHRCADMLLRAETSFYLAALACLKLGAGAPDAALQIAAAKLKASHAAHENGRAVIQIHGGLGFQSECDAHWFMKRAHVYDQAGGNMQAQADRLFGAPPPVW
ncbi:MAG: acyl-CoA dehydrogenase family protein [Sphingomonadales bacterium]|nr:acyl-CoA dehydrogenase family protein [Sphingomonadales bacterium]